MESLLPELKLLIYGLLVWLAWPLIVVSLLLVAVGLIYCWVYVDDLVRGWWRSKR